ncbi:MAG: GumC domain-containing protein [Limisphaerales bacterium]
MNYGNQFGFEPPAGPPQGSTGLAHPHAGVGPEGAPPRSANGAAAAAGPRTGEGSSLPLDVWAFSEVILRRWGWVVAGAALLALAGLAAGLKLWHNQYTVLVQLIRYESPNAPEVFPPRQTSPQTFAAVIKAPQVLEHVSALTHGAVSPDQLADGLRVIPERNSDMITVSLSQTSPRGLVDLANLYAEEAVRYTQQIQAQSAGEVNDYLQGQIAQLDTQIAALNEKLSAGKWYEWSDADPLVSTRPVSAERLQERLAVAQEQLADLLGHWREAHPLVLEQRAKIASLEKQLADLEGKAATNSPSGARGTGTGAGSDTRTGKVRELAHKSDYEDLRAQLQALETGRMTLAGRQGAAQVFVDHPPGYYRLYAPALAKDVLVHKRLVKVVFLGVFGGLMGAVAVTGVVLLVEVFDNRVKTVADVARVTRLPLIAALGDLDRMDSAARAGWAFRAWIALQHRLSPSPNHGLICGIISSRPSEGRSAWVSLLAQAASQRGFRVLTIATRPSPAHAETAEQPEEPAHGAAAGPGASQALTTNVLTSPAEITQKLVGPDPQPHIHIPLPGWVWNLERRQQWQAALNHWRKINNLVILVELPPACVPEAMLLAENLPNLLWLADSGSSEAGETRVQLETLRHARCNLVGALLNRESAPSIANRFPRWFVGVDGYAN